VSHREDIIPGCNNLCGRSPAHFQSASRFCNRTFLHDSGFKQHHGLRLQLRVCPPCPDDGLNRGNTWPAINSPLVHTAFYIRIIAWESATMVLCWWAAVRLLKSYRADRAQFATALNVAVIALTEPADVVGGIPRCRRRMVSDVAVAKVERAGSGVPNVYHCRRGVFDCATTRANSRLGGAMKNSHPGQQRRWCPGGRSLQTVCGWAR